MDYTERQKAMALLRKRMARVEELRAISAERIREAYALVLAKVPDIEMCKAAVDSVTCAQQEVKDALIDIALDFRNLNKDIPPGESGSPEDIDALMKAYLEERLKPSPKK